MKDFVTDYGRGLSVHYLLCLELQRMGLDRVVLCHWDHQTMM